MIVAALTAANLADVTFKQELLLRVPALIAFSYLPGASVRSVREALSRPRYRTNFKNTTVNVGFSSFWSWFWWCGEQGVGFVFCFRKGLDEDNLSSKRIRKVKKFNLTIWDLNVAFTNYIYTGWFESTKWIIFQTRADIRLSSWLALMHLITIAQNFTKTLWNEVGHAKFWLSKSSAGYNKVKFLGI